MSRKKNIVSDIIIEDIEFPNKGIGYFEDKAVYVKNTIPGQKVNVCIKRKKQKYEGRVLEILEKADYEISPACSDFGKCGGCTYQNISYEKELEFKKNNVLKLLNQINIGDYEFLGVEGSPSIQEYRNKMEFSFGDTGVSGELSLGMRKRESYYEVVNADNCILVDEDVRKIVRCVRDFFKNSEDTFYHKTKKVGSLRHLLVRKAYFTGEILVNLITTKDIKSDLNQLKELLLNINFNGKLVGFLHTINESVADIVKADELNLLYGQDYFVEKLLGLKFKISVFSFFQTNSKGAELLYSKIRDFAGDVSEKVVFDLYCGTGTIAQIMSVKAKKVIGVELVEEAVEAAKINAKLNNIDNCQFIDGDVLKIVDELSEKPDLIILDPPREGIHPKAIGKIVNFGAKKLVYVSCKASSLVKDLQFFADNGYAVEKIQCVDMFPYTYHIETVVLLSRQLPDEHINIDIDLDELDLTSAEAKATYKEIKDYVMEKYNTKVSSLYISQIKRKCGIEMGDNYNLAKSKNSRVPTCPENKEVFIRDALRHFKMI